MNHNNYHFIIMKVTHRHGSNRMHYGQKSIQGHEHQCVNTGVGGDHNEVLYNLAPDISERPEGQDIISGGKGHTEYDEQQIGDSEIDDEEVGSTAHLLIGCNHQHNL